jgi:hypothetical protein
LFFVPQVLTDNAANCKSSWPKLEERFPWITCGGCVPHSLDLLSEDWGKQPWVKELICQTLAITRAVTSRQGLLAEFTDTLKGGRPQRPGATRFMSYFLSLQNAYANRDKYAALTLSEAWKVRKGLCAQNLFFVVPRWRVCEQHACATH